jgi:hypothetical protein
LDLYRLRSKFGLEAKNGKEFRNKIVLIFEHYLEKLISLEKEFNPLYIIYMYIWTLTLERNDKYLICPENELYTDLTNYFYGKDRCRKAFNNVKLILECTKTISKGLHIDLFYDMRCKFKNACKEHINDFLMLR